MDITKQPWWVWTGGWYELNGEENYYFKHDYLTADSVVLEAGSYRGKFAAGIAERYGCRVEGYEPSFFSRAAALVETAKYPTVTIHPYGLSDREERRILYDTHRDSSNLFVGEQEPSELVSLVDVAQVVHDLGHVDLFSINCEGWEFHIFPRLIDTGELRLVERMMIQWHAVVEDADARKMEIQSTFAKEYRMLWNLGAWEMWERT